jgi:hypothetical protein
MNIKGASALPLRSLKTAVLPHIAGHLRHTAASAANAVNKAFFNLIKPRIRENHEGNDEG